MGTDDHVVPSGVRIAVRLLRIFGALWFCGAVWVGCIAWLAVFIGVTGGRISPWLADGIALGAAPFMAGGSVILRFANSLQTAHSEMRHYAPPQRLAWLRLAVNAMKVGCGFLAMMIFACVISDPNSDSSPNGGLRLVPFVNFVAHAVLLWLLYKCSRRLDAKVREGYRLRG